MIYAILCIISALLIRQLVKEWRENDRLSVMCRTRAKELARARKSLMVWKSQTLGIKAASDDPAQAHIFNAAPELYAACQDYQHLTHVEEAAPQSIIDHARKVVALSMAHAVAKAEGTL